MSRFNFLLFLSRCLGSLNKFTEEQHLNNRYSWFKHGLDDDFRKRCLNLMKLNLFNTVNNEERGRGQRSVVWLKRSQSCLHHLHVLSTGATLFV